ncbi:Protein T05A7.1 [Aphelenchoides avenae]|nr:Protein T05A7.1 [Aphelenchus avenae]
MYISVGPRVLYSLALVALCRSTSADCDECEDKKNNLIRAASPKHPLRPVRVWDLKGTVYKPNMKPACNDGRPTVLMPGYVKLLDGKVKVPKKYDLVKSGTLKLTIKGANFDSPLCKDGESQYLALPSSFCTVDLCGWIGKELCEFLETPGTHSLKDMEEKIGFNSTMALPEPPSLLGISLLDLFSGEFSFAFSLISEGETILQLNVPTNHKFLQIGIEPDDAEE